MRLSRRFFFFIDSFQRLAICLAASFLLVCLLCLERKKEKERERKKERERERERKESRQRESLDRYVVAAELARQLSIEFCT